MIIEKIKKYGSKLFILFIFILSSLTFTFAQTSLIESNRYGTYNVGGYTYTNSPITYGPQIPNSNVPRIVCPLNYTIKSSSCVPNQKTCKSGMIVNFYEECLKTCWEGILDGKQIQEDLTCPQRPRTTQTYTTDNLYNKENTINIRVCANGSQSNASGQCYKTCPNGAIIIESDVCPTQTKICNSGKIVPYTSVCTKTCDNGSEVNESATCFVNNDVTIVTSQASNISTGDVKLSGLVLMPREAMGVSYFEYSQSSNFTNINRTNSANISGYTKYNIANTIEQLIPDTNYYFRSVVEVSGRAYKGEIVNFRTLSEIPSNKIIKNSTYNNTSSVSLPKVANPAPTGAVKEAESVTKVSTTTSDKNKNSLSTSKDQLLSMHLERVSEKSEIGKQLMYKLSYLNTKEVDIKNIIFTIKTPANLKYLSSTIGTYDNESGVLTIKREDLQSSERGSVEIIYQISSEVIVGTNIITSAKANYEYDENNKTIVEDSETYIITTISGANGNQVASDGDGLFSNMLFRILFILILFLILFILGKRLYNERAIVALRNKILKNKKHIEVAH